MRLNTLLLTLLIPTVAAANGSGAKLAVLPLKSGHGVAKGVAEVATDALVTSLQAAGAQVITTRDIESALGFESEKAKVNVEVAKRMGDEVCVDNQACLAEIGGALGVALVVSGSVSRIGSSAVLTAQLFDQRKAVVLRRFQQSAKSDDDAAFLELARLAGAALMGREQTPPTAEQRPTTVTTTPAPQQPAQPSRVALFRPPTGSACDAQWKAYVAASAAVPLPDALADASKRLELTEQSIRMAPLVQEPAQKAALAFALAELYAAELLFTLRVAHELGKPEPDAARYGVESLGYDRPLIEQPRFSRWAESVFRSSLVYYVLGDLQSADALCRRLPKGFRTKPPGR